VIAALAARQHGLVTVAQLLEAGLNHKAISRRVAAGRLHRVARGVYAVGHGGLSREGLLLVAVLGAGKGAALSRLAAAELWEVRRYRASLIDVVVPKWRPPKDGTRLHRARQLHPRDVTTHKNIPVTSIPRTLVDLSDVLTPHQLANVIHEAAYRGRYSLLATRDAIARANGRHNLDVLHQAIALHEHGSAGTKSRSEDHFLSLLQLAGVPEPLVNTHIHGVEPDFHWPDARVAVEVDGPGHGRPRTQREDALKDQILKTAGYTVLRVTDLEQRPDAVLAALRAAL
jgi:hypothetical protein